MEPIATAEKNICRLCIKNEGKVPIFQDDGHLRVLAVQIMAISNVKVSSSDGLPTHICSECVNLIQSSFNFKVLCEASDSTLRATLVTNPAATQDFDSSASSEIAAISSQLNDTRNKLNETSHKLNTLVTSLEDLQHKYCNDVNKRPSSGKRVRIEDKNNAPVYNSSRVGKMSVGSDKECFKNDINILNPLNFKGFSVNVATPGYRKLRKKCSSHHGDIVEFPSVPFCYLVELDSDTEWEMNCSFPDALPTSDTH